MSTAHWYNALINLILIQGKSEYIVVFVLAFLSGVTYAKAVKAINVL